MKVRQNVTYHCRNSNAFKTSSGKAKTFVKIMSSDAVEMHIGAQKKNQPKILSDGCNVSSVLIPSWFLFYTLPQLSSRLSFDWQ